MPHEYRIDAGGRIESRIDDNGYLRVSGTIAKVGVYHYRNADGSTRAELVTAECLRDDGANKTLMGVPATVLHPKEGLINSSTAKIYSRGSVAGNPQFNNDQLNVDLVLTHQDAIDAVKNRGMEQLSPGYTVELDFTPGTYNGERYDCVQKSRRYNHLALVPNARGGSKCRLNLDGIDCEIEVDHGHFNNDAKEDKRMATVTLPNGATVEVGDASTASAIQNAFRADADEKARLDGEIKTLKTERDTLKGRCDGFEEEAKKKEEDDEENMDKRVDSALAVIESAKILKTDLEIRKDGKLKSERDLMCESLGKNFDGQSDEYVRARFDAAVEVATEKNKDDKLKKQRSVDTNRRTDADGKPVLSATEQHRQKFYKGEA